MDHTIVEKRIKRDIVLKNTMLKKMRRMNAKALRWREQANTVGNRRRQKKYRATVGRFLDEISRLRPVAQEMIEDLDERIHEELNFSREEVRTFKEDLAEEKARMDKVAGELKAVREKLKKDTDSLEGIPEESAARAREIKEELKKDQARARRLKKKEEEEARQVEALKGELKSEAVDEKIMTEELKRIEEEKKIIASVPEGGEAVKEAE